MIILREHALALTRVAAVLSIGRSISSGFVKNAHGRDKPGHAALVERCSAALPCEMRYFGSTAMLGKKK
jgi:hypothetical protein